MSHLKLYKAKTAVVQADFSGEFFKNPGNEKVLSLLFELAQEILEQSINEMKRINFYLTNRKKLIEKSLLAHCMNQEHLLLRPRVIILVGEVEHAQ